MFTETQAQSNRRIGRHYHEDRMRDNRINIDYAERAGLPFAVIVRTARLLKQHGLLRNAESKAPSHDPPRHN